MIYRHWHYPNGSTYYIIYVDYYNMPGFMYEDAK